MESYKDNMGRTWTKCPKCAVFFPNGKHSKKICAEHAKGREMRERAGKLALGRFNKSISELMR